MSVASSRRADIIANSARRAVKHGIVGQRVLFNRHADLIMRPLVYGSHCASIGLTTAHLAPGDAQSHCAEYPETHRAPAWHHLPRAPSKDQLLKSWRGYVASLLLLGPVSVRQPVRVELGAGSGRSIDDPLPKYSPPHDIA